MLTWKAGLRPVRQRVSKPANSSNPQGSHQQSETPLGAQTGSLCSPEEIRTGNLDLD